MPRDDAAAEVEAICACGLVGVDAVRVRRVVDAVNRLLALFMIMSSALHAMQPSLKS